MNKVGSMLKPLWGERKKKKQHSLTLLQRYQHSTLESKFDAFLIVRLLSVCPAGAKASAAKGPNGRDRRGLSSGGKWKKWNINKEGRRTRWEGWERKEGWGQFDGRGLRRLAKLIQPLYSEPPFSRSGERGWGNEIRKSRGGVNG